MRETPFRRLLPESVLMIAVLVTALASSPRAQLVLHAVSGQLGSFGLAVSGGGRIDSDEFHEFLVGDPLNGPGYVHLYQGVDGALLNARPGLGGMFGQALAEYPRPFGPSGWMVGEPLYATFGRVVVYTGSSTFPVAQQFGLLAGSEFGASVASIGDLDGDGYNEYLVGAPFDTNTGGVGAPATGRVFLYRGFSHQLWTAFTGDFALEEFGRSVAAAGDVNRDGVPDFVIGAPSAAGISPGTGAARVYSGADFALLAEIQGDIVGARFGSSVAGADLDGDYYADIIVGEPNATTVGTASGRVRVYSGKKLTNQDPNAQMYSWSGASPGDHFGVSVSVTPFKDHDLDGFRDVAIGADQSDPLSSGSGYVQVRSGKDGSFTYSVSGDADNDGFGYAVRFMGDVNDDCAPDLIVGSLWGGYARVLGFDFGGVPTKSRLLWLTTQALEGVEIEVYEFDSNGNVVVVTTIETTLTGADGTFCLPCEVAQGSGPRGVRALVLYDEDTGATGAIPKREIRVYLDHRVDRLESDPTLVDPITLMTPLPTLFQPGVSGMVNSDWNGSYGLWRDYMQLDPGATDNEIAILAGFDGTKTPVMEAWRDDKRVSKIPAFLTWGMPSGDYSWLDNDNVPWGYDNSVLQTSSSVDFSADQLQGHFDSNIGPEIMSLSQNWQSVPVNIVAHSLGGLITRDWISRGAVYPRVQRYATYDSPHGGLAAGIRLYPFWNIEYMNGVSLSGLPATDGAWGWNHYHRVNKKKSALMFGAPGNWVIAPNSSAHGLGQIALPGSELIPLPNGCSERFNSGWQLDVSGQGHSIQLYTPAIESVARFLRDGLKPQLGSTKASYGGSSVGCSDDAAFSGGAIWSHVEQELRLSGGVTASEVLHFDAGEQLTVAMSVENGGTVKIKDSNGSEYSKLNEVTENLEGISTSIFGIQVSSGTSGTIELSGPGDVWAGVNVTYGTAYHAAVGTPSLNYDGYANVTIRARLRDKDAALVVPTATTLAEAVVTKPDGSTATVNLFDDGANDDLAAGDGVYGGIFSDTGSAGRYQIRGDLIVTAPGGQSVRRNDDGLFVIDATGTVDGIVSGILTDDDLNNQWDGLDVTVDVTANEAGEYRVRADVSDNGTIVAEVSTTLSVSFAPLSTSVVLHLDNQLLHQLGSGTTTLVRLENISLTHDTEALFLDSFPLWTQSYSLVNFDLPPLAIAGVLPSIGSAGFDVVLSGLGLTETTGVTVGGTPATFVLMDDYALQVTIPAGPAGQTVDVSVTTAWDSDTGASLFTYTGGSGPGCEFDLGFGGPGDLRLDVCGDPFYTIGGTGTAVVSNGGPSAPAVLFMGLGQLNAPFKGGTLVPIPLIVLSLPLDPTGGLSLPYTTAGPIGVDAYLQFGAVDATQLSGVELSNAILLDGTP